MTTPNQFPCPVCGRTVAVRASGRLYRHGARECMPGCCAGTGVQVAPLEGGRARAWEELKALVYARQILHVRGSTVDSVHVRGVAQSHLDRVIERLREICRPRLTP